jgi:addiction module RelE/StbE family toxin
LKLFISNPSAPELNNHALHGEYLGYRSVNITGDWRAVYEVQEDNAIKFLFIDTHSNLY